MINEKPYDETDEQSVVSYAEKLLKKTLRDVIELDSITSPKLRRGSWGTTLEEEYFGIPSNSSPEPDFAEIGLELKSTPMKQRKNGYFVAKERLVLHMIDYNSVVDEEFLTSSLMKKIGKILLISYVWNPNQDPLDYLIEIVKTWKIPEEDLSIIEQDWQTIVGKVRAGKAHEISGSDTLYLEACTKGRDSRDVRSQPFSDVPAKRRAWALKASYMTHILNGLLEEMTSLLSAKDAQRGLYDVILERFTPYFGRTLDSLSEEFGYVYPDKKRAPKNLPDLITRKILGVKGKEKIVEFEKAGIKPRTIRLQRSGYPKESLPFPAFNYMALVDTPFEESKFLQYLEEKYLFVIYQQDEQEKNVYRLKDVLLWQMNDSDIEEARECYEEMQRRVRNGQADRPVRSRENRCCHVRPHGRNAQDVLPTPNGDYVRKSSFWLNSRYVGDEIRRTIEGREASL